MAINLISEYEVDSVTVRVKFEPSLRSSTITNQRFSLYTDAATPVLVEADPFKPLDLTYDYNSISRILILSWKDDVLESDTDYKLRLAGFKNAYNQPVDDAWIDFSTAASATPTYSDPTIPDPIEIVDYSLVPDLFTSTTTAEEEVTATSAFTVTETNPLTNDAFLPADYNDGVLVIKFNNIPNPTYLTSEFFIVERKKIQRGPIRWEPVEVEIEAHETNPWVYVKFPSTDDTPVYDTPGKEYFETNYRYRVRILKNVGV